ncbi:hypothetical protein CON84_19395 [Bacillus sp. AFS094228]|nr:hypothetical protein CON84_19395 [Bacillus sp. AFS094228]
MINSEVHKDLPKDGRLFLMQLTCPVSAIRKIAGTNGTVWSSVDASCEVTDSKAEKVGYDMNAVGTYKLTGKLNNGYIVLTSYIKLTSLNKTSKLLVFFKNVHIEIKIFNGVELK